MQGSREDVGDDHAGDPGVPVAGADPARAGDARVRRLRARDRRCTRCSPATHPFPDVLARRGCSIGISTSRCPRSVRRAPGPPAGRRRRDRGATAKDATDRFADVARARRRVPRALEGTRRAREPLAEIRNPYKGLRAFLEADAGDFFGREAVDRAARATARASRGGCPVPRGRRAVGFGKSSVVRADWSRRSARGAARLRSLVRRSTCSPARTRFDELEAALLGVAVEPPPVAAGAAGGDELGLVRAANACSPTPMPSS